MVRRVEPHEAGGEVLAVDMRRTGLGRGRGEVGCQRVKESGEGGLGLGSGRGRLDWGLTKEVPRKYGRKPCCGGREGILVWG